MEFRLLATNQIWQIGTKWGQVKAHRILWFWKILLNEESVSPEFRKHFSFCYFLLSATDADLHGCNKETIPTTEALFNHRSVNLTCFNVFMHAFFINMIFFVVVADQSSQQRKKSWTVEMSDPPTHCQGNCDYSIYAKVDPRPLDCPFQSISLPLLSCWCPRQLTALLQSESFLALSRSTFPLHAVK